ncbi:hypothetical protein PACTADRAFT_31144 [Pachysolen tannophilus NRRL Y-2460]|uniref:Endonuclease/exonuclease/phosphatase domain-containing protein n=1 Tax=Pachysolen tannophilus NRRL Y-2460 TaxID=669874 RepID=A0A1E4U1C3_PACTA|nr:hypothetical protein PACTADRAFT_31144 [Pachysolen tannophilus NRRL Y-2460]
MGNPKVKLLTFNTWGLKYVSKFRKQRLTALAERLSNPTSESDNYDVVALQEIWCAEDWELIDKLCTSLFPYRRWFSSGIIAGPGLAILSKIPIESTFLYRFPINGRPSAFFRGDWYVGKSIAVAKLKPLTKNSSPVAILNSHMHAPYSLVGDAAYSTHRTCQAWDFAEIASTLSKAGYAVIIVGDLNSKPGSLPFRIFQAESGVKDSWELINGVQDLNEIKEMPAELQIEVGGTTCDSLLNTWRADRKPDEACRLDYAFIDDKKLKPIDAKVVFTEKIPNIGSYSDHFAYTTTLEVLPITNTNNEINVNSDILNLKKKLYLDIKLEITNYINKTVPFQKNWRMLHFFISYLLIIGVLVAITFPAVIAPWSAVLLCLFGIVLAVTGTANGMICYLFGRSELRNLKEVLMECDDKMRSINELIKESN